MKLIRLRSRNQITLPSDVVPADMLADGLFEVEVAEGTIRLKPVRVVRAGSAEATAQEKRADADFREGRFKSFDSVDDLTAALDEGVQLRGIGERPKTSPALRPQPLTKQEETSLVHAAQQGDRAAFEELIRLNDQAVLRVAMRLTGSLENAQEIYQEAFLKAYRNIARIQPETRFSTWMFRIVTNLCLEHLRKQKRAQTPRTDSGLQSHERPDTAVPGGKGVEHQVTIPEVSRYVERGLARLTPRERMVFELINYEGLKLSTIAKMLDSDASNIAHTAQIAQRKIRHALRGADAVIERGAVRAYVAGLDERAAAVLPVARRRIFSDLSNVLAASERPG